MSAAAAALQKCYRSSWASHPSLRPFSVFLAFLTGMLCHSLSNQDGEHLWLLLQPLFPRRKSAWCDVVVFFFQSVSSLVGAFKLFWEFVLKVLSWCKLLYNSLTLLCSTCLPPPAPMHLLKTCTILAFPSLVVSFLSTTSFQKSCFSSLCIQGQSLPGLVNLKTSCWSLQSSSS